MTEDPLPYGSENVNMALRPLKVVPFRKEHYFKCPSGFWKRTDLSAEQKGMTGILLGHMNKESCCWPTHPQLQEMSHMGHRKVERILKELRVKKVIDWVHFHDEFGHRRNRYILLFLRNPTPENGLLATPPKRVVKVLAKYLKGKDTVEEQSERYG